jgi:hypothetical protein
VAAAKASPVPCDIWSSDSDVFLRLLLANCLNVGIVRRTHYRGLRQTVVDILRGIAYQALCAGVEAKDNVESIVKAARGDSVNVNVFYCQMGVVLVLAWLLVCKHDMKPNVRGCVEYQVFFKSLALHLVQTQNWEVQQVFALQNNAIIMCRLRQRR